VSKNIKINKQKYNFSAVLCGYETWSLTLKEEQRLKIFEKRVLKRIFGTKRGEVTGDRTKLHS
jgi:hypothetical protein